MWMECKEYQWAYLLYLCTPLMGGCAQLSHKAASTKHKLRDKITQNFQDSNHITLIQT
jgi:hypothetical protein